VTKAEAEKRIKAVWPKGRLIIQPPTSKLDTAWVVRAMRGTHRPSIWICVGKQHGLRRALDMAVAAVEASK